MSDASALSMEASGFFAKRRRRASQDNVRSPLTARRLFEARGGDGALDELVPPLSVDFTLAMSMSPGGGLASRPTKAGVAMTAG